MKDDNNVMLGQLMQKYRITFNHDLEPQTWPATHAGRFHDIQQTWQESFDTYKNSIPIRQEQEPWRIETALKAVDLRYLTIEALQEHRNEAGWRFKLETEILARFKAKEICPNCNDRIWRSEIEASIGPPTKDSSSLGRRRKERRPCRCTSASRHETIDANRLNSVFSDRVQERVYHDDALEAELPKNEPDRIYGLRRTQGLAKALNHLSQDACRFSPFRKAIDPLLFPFLVLEAKAEKSPDSWLSIERQTAFPIMALLRMQEELQQLCEPRPEWADGPLVWFLANKGNDWRLYAAFGETTDAGRSYRILLLRQETTTSNTGALHLLLMIDYILDWARDIYRDAILRHLKCLSKSDLHDDAILSEADGDTKSKYPLMIEHEVSKPTHGVDMADTGVTSDPLYRLKSGSGILNTPKGHYRNGAEVESDFLGLFVTGDNVNRLLSSINGEDKRERFSRDVLTTLADGISLRGRVLDDIEEFWTGELRTCTNPNVRDSFFSVRLLYRTWLADDWSLRKQVGYLAVDQEAASALMTRSLYKRKPNVSLPCDATRVLDVCKSLKSSSVGFNLRAAISRKALVFDNRIIATKKPTRGGAQKKVRPSRNVKLVAQNVKDKAYDLIHKIYEQNKIGDLEPSRGFIRYSTRSEVQDSDLDSTPFPTSVTLDSVKGLVLVGRMYAGNAPLSSRYSDVCLFQVSLPQRSLDEVELMKHLENTMFEDVLVCMTLGLADQKSLRSPRKLKRPKPSDISNWNLESKVTTARGRFYRKIQDWIIHLSQKVGSYRHVLTATVDRQSLEQALAMTCSDDRDSDMTSLEAHQQNISKALVLLQSNEDSTR